ncbi:N-terminal acetyltransferase complex ard1 subunit, putative, partial [Entamoeba dispar SAW760]
MICVRRATAQDLFSIQNYQLTTEEGYQSKYYYYHFLSWPYLMYVAETINKKIVGYTIMKTDEETKEGLCTVQVTNLVVSESYRRMKIGTQLLKQTINAAIEIYGARIVRARSSEKGSPGSKFLEKMGFLMVGEYDYIELYKKVLDLDDQLNSDDISPAAVAWRK